MPALNEARFKNTVLAILTACQGLGSVQLRKALIIADALHLTLFGESLTGARYIKFPYGPVPDRDADNLIYRMFFGERLIDIIEEPEGRTTKNSHFALVQPDTEIFSEEENNIIRFAADTALKYSASRLSDMSHDKVYNETPMFGEIPLDRVCTMTVMGRFDTPPFTEEEKRDLTRVLSSDEARQFAFI